MTASTMPDDSPTPLYFRHPDLTVCSVKWPHGGWIVWNWLAPSWDRKTDEERQAIKDAERLAFGSPAHDRPLRGDA